MIGRDMTIKQAADSSEQMKEVFRWLIVQETEEEWNSPLSQFGSETCQLAASALNSLQENMEKKVPCLLDLYTEEEKKKNGTLMQTELIFLPGKENAPYILMCPGGAYMMVDLLGEGMPIAYVLNQAGYNVFLLKYRIGIKGLMPDILDDVNRAMEVIGEYAEKLKISTDGYMIMGTSAGAHLASMWAVASLGYEKYRKPKPDAVILGYPAASTLTFYNDLEHKTGDEMYLMVADIYLSLVYGEGYTGDMVGKYSLETLIDENYPPVYMIHSEDDPTVHVTGSKDIRSALEMKGVPHRFKTIKSSGHGFGVGIHADAKGWLEEAIHFCEANK